MGYTSVGDVLCLEGDCDVGELLVKEMVTVYSKGLPAFSAGSGPLEMLRNVQEAIRTASPAQKAFATKFGASFEAITKQYASLQGSWLRRVPFTTRCCSIKELGRKAQSLTQKMHEHLGSVPTDKTTVDDPFSPNTGLTGSFINIVKWGMIAFIGVTLLNMRKQ